MWQRLATSELLSTFFPTWLRRDKHAYWLNSSAHPVLSIYYPIQYTFWFITRKQTSLDDSFKTFLGFLIAHVAMGFLGWYYLLQSFSGMWVSIFGALTLTFGAYSLKQQPCIIYTLAWFPLTLYQDPVISSIAVGMMLLAGYYPFAIYLLPISVAAHILWFQEAFLLAGVIVGLPQIIPFLRYLPKTVKRITDKCQSPEVERRFYVGVIPIMLLPFSTSRIWPLTLVACLAVLGVGKSFFPRVHERWLIVVQFCIGWSSVSALNNLNLTQTQLVCLTGLHAFDLYWHNRSCIPPRPWCELYQKPSWVFNTRLTRYLEANLGDNRVAGLPWPLFTGLVNGFKTMGYQGSMQLKLMAKWRGTTGSHGIEGISNDDLRRYRVKYAFSRKKLDWEPTGIPYLYLNPEFKTG